MTVYHASNSIEAYLIKNLLEQQEIAAYVFGDYIQGGVGEIPSICLVTVNVSDTDYIRAKEIVDEWDASVIVEDFLADNNYVLA